MKQILLLLLSISLVAGCERPKGFTLSKVTSSYGADPRWDVENDLSPSELAALLQGPYTYLGSGNHTYAFMSRDEKTVIKFFKQKHMRVQSLFLSSETKLRRAKERLESFSSYLLAYEKLRDETGLLYLHLNPTHHLHQTVTLIDQHGKEHRVNLDEMEFLIQKKATLSFEMPQLIEAASTIFTPKEEMELLVKKLKNQGYRLIILSNTFQPHIEYLSKNFTILPYFDHHIYSYEVGYAKPEPKIYELALKKAECDPTECFFIDDKIENIRPAEILGIQCHHFRTPSLLMDDLIRSGIL